MLTKDQDEKKLHGTECTDEDDYNFCDFLFEERKRHCQTLFKLYCFCGFKVGL